MTDPREQARVVPVDKLPGFIGALAEATAIAQVRLYGGPASMPLPAGATPPNLVTAEAVAESFGVPVSQVYEQARQGRIPCVTMGKYRRFDLADVRRALEQPGGAETLALGTRRRNANGHAASRGSARLAATAAATDRGAG